MKKVLCGITLLASLSFSSVQNIANISDLKESIVILIESQEAISLAIESIQSKQREIEKQNLELGKQISDSKIKNNKYQSIWQKEKEEIGKRLDNNQDKIKKLSEEIGQKLKDFQENRDSQANTSLLNLEEIKNMLKVLEQRLSSLEYNKNHLMGEKNKNKNQIVVIQLDDYIIDENGKVYSIKDLNMNEIATDDESETKIKPIIEAMLKETNKKKQENEKKANIDQAGQKKIEDLGKRVDWLNYKIDSIEKLLKKCCKDPDGSEIILEYELK